MYFSVMQGYGMTETTFSAISVPREHEMVQGAIGVVIPNTEAKVNIRQ